jgi:hypothetical protein
MVANPSQIDRGSAQTNRFNVIKAAYGLGKKPLHFYLDLPTRIADALQAIGSHRLAEQFLWRVYNAHPYDSSLGEHLAVMAFHNHEREYRSGTVERGRFIMQLLMKSYPAQLLMEAYFLNLQQIMRNRPPLKEPGRVVLGIGAGRCGSTTLAAILHSSQDAVSTHENPPFVFWEATPRQAQFHLERFRVFSQYFPLVADCSHWWINLLDTVFDAFPNSKAVGLYRDTEACVRSWMQVSPADINHFVAPYNRVWLSDRWDPLYPHYEVPGDAKRNPAMAKEQLVRRYVREYNERLHALAARLPDRVLLLRTEELDLPKTREELSRFIGLPVSLEPRRLNIGVDSDSSSVDDIYF